MVVTRSVDLVVPPDVRVVVAVVRVVEVGVWVTDVELRVVAAGVLVVVVEVLVVLLGVEVTECAVVVVEWDAGVVALGAVLVRGAVVVLGAVVLGAAAGLDPELAGLEGAAGLDAGLGAEGLALKTASGIDSRVARTKEVLRNWTLFMAFSILGRTLSVNSLPDFGNSVALNIYGAESREKYSLAGKNRGGDVSLPDPQGRIIYLIQSDWRPTDRGWGYGRPDRAVEPDAKRGPGGGR